MWTVNFQMFKLPFRKGRGTRDQIANICWIIKKEREFQKNIYFCFIDYAKAFYCVLLLVSHFSRVWLFAKLWTIACQAALSKGFSRQEYWGGLPSRESSQPRDWTQVCITSGFFTRWATMKRSVFIPIPKKGNTKECSNYCTIAVISHASKVMLKILQTRLQQYMNLSELPDVPAGFRKGRGTRDQTANIHWIIEKAREPEKRLLLLYWLQQSLWLCRSQQTVENSSRDGNTRPPDLPPEKSVCRSRSNN